LNLVIGLSGKTIDFACPVSPETRIELDGQLADFEALAPGDRLQVRCFLDQLADFTTDQLPPPANPWEPNTTATLRDAEGEVQVTRVHHGYEADYDLFVLVAADRLPSIRPRWIRAWRARSMPEDNTGSGALWPNRVTIWRGGRVQSIDAGTRTIVVEPWEFRNHRPSGLQIIDGSEAAGQTLRLDEIARQRLACVRRWQTGEEAVQRFLLDDAVDFTFNGLFDATIDDVRSGDAVTIRYDCRYDGAPEIRPEIVRISRPHE
jgi:hypothetical protein